MKRFWIFKGLRVLMFVAAAAAVMGFAVMTLWNWVLPPTTGLHAISFAQAVAMLVLARLLFGGLRAGRGGGWHWRHRLRGHWEQMSPEERARFREALSAGEYRCGPWGRRHAEEGSPGAGEARSS